MTDMERRRLQLYAKSAHVQLLRRKIEVLEAILGPLYHELEQYGERAPWRPKARAPKKARRR